MSPKEKTLSTTDICSIIEACGKSQVRVLKYAGLYLELGKTPIPLPLATPFVVPAEPPTPAPRPVAEITDIQKLQAERSLLMEELDVRDEQMADMWVTDPYKAEQMLINGELEDTNEPKSDESDE